MEETLTLQEILGIVEEEASTKTLTPQEIRDNAFADLLTFTTNTFYGNPEYDIKVRFGDDNYYDQKEIVLSKVIMDEFQKINIPRFIIYYHEVGHHLYSHPMFKILKMWEQIKAGPVAFDKRYLHLVNWIEDFFIEEKLLDDYFYLTDIINCIRKIPPAYDIRQIEYAFNFYYTYKGVTPALSYTDAVVFKTYIDTLLKMRRAPMFGSGVIMQLYMKPNRETSYVKTIIEFYKWCQSRGIFPPDDVTLPELTHPTNYLAPEQGNDGSMTNNNIDDSDENKAGSDGDKNGSYSDGNLGSHVVYKEMPVTNRTAQELIEEYVAENKLIDKHILDMSQTHQTENVTLDGLFNSRLKVSPFIQTRVIIPNFFNPNRIQDMMLFNQQTRTYNNVAIFRDVSGSVCGYIHYLIHLIMEQLIKDIPVPVDFYIYGSDLVKVDYISWNEYDDTPYDIDVGCSTNSDLIADAITQQFDDRFLNIIITDGDLYQLYNRENIEGLLQNVFIIYVKSEPDKRAKNYIVIEDVQDLPKIYPALAKLERT